MNQTIFGANNFFFKIELSGINIDRTFKGDQRSKKNLNPQPDKILMMMMMMIMLIDVLLPLLCTW